MATETASRAASAQAGVQLCPSGMEYSLHRSPKSHLREIKTLFPDLQSVEDVIIVPTCQPSRANLLNSGEVVDKEKDDLLEVFVAWAQAVCERLDAEGYWADYIDPCSGLPMVHTQYQQPYSEVDGLATLLKYPIQNAGGCKVILHPKWGGNVYPASLFAKAPADKLQAAIDAVNSSLEDAR